MSTSMQGSALWRRFNYQDTLPENYDDFRKLLENYSNVPPEEVEAHLYRIVSRYQSPF